MIENSPPINDKDKPTRAYFARNDVKPRYENIDPRKANVMPSTITNHKIIVATPNTIPTIAQISRAREGLPSTEDSDSKGGPKEISGNLGGTEIAGIP